MEHDGLDTMDNTSISAVLWLYDAPERLSVLREIRDILQGRRAEARKLFDRLLSCCNDVGLLAEEYDPLTGRMLGNFPQAYSHVGLINCALNLSRQTDPGEERAESEADRPSSIVGPEPEYHSKGIRRRRRHHHRAASSRCTTQAARAGRNAPRRIPRPPRQGIKNTSHHELSEMRVFAALHESGSGP
jgi:hypothetical protein